MLDFSDCFGSSPLLWEGERKGVKFSQKANPDPDSNFVSNSNPNSNPDTCMTVQRSLLLLPIGKAIVLVPPMEGVKQKGVKCGTQKANSNLASTLTITLIDSTQFSYPIAPPQVGGKKPFFSPHGSGEEPKGSLNPSPNLKTYSCKPVQHTLSLTLTSVGFREQMEVK